MQWRRSFGMWLLASLFATCIPSRNFMGGARTWQLRACRRVHLLRRLHIRSLLAVFLLNFVFFPHGRRPYWRESLAFFPHKRSTGALGGQACLGWPRCLLVCGLALFQNGELLSFGPPHNICTTNWVCSAMKQQWSKLSESTPASRPCLESVVAIAMQWSAIPRVLDALGVRGIVAWC